MFRPSDIGRAQSWNGVCAAGPLVGVRFCGQFWAGDHFPTEFIGIGEVSRVSAPEGVSRGLDDTPHSQADGHSVGGGGFDLEHERRDGEPGDADQRHWRGRLERSEAGTEQVKVLHGFVHVGGVDVEARDVGEIHVGGTQDGLEVVEPRQKSER